MMKDNIKGKERELKNRKELIELFEDIQGVEIMARNNYEKDVVTFKNFILTDTIEKIKKDEDKHIEMIEEIIKMLKKNT